MKFYTPFRKVDAQDDGTIVVSGIASTEAVDADGEIIKASAIAAALPDFMRHGTGALREMHQLSAAGTVISARVEDGETMIEAHVVDPIAVKKVQAGVYKGFSVGGKVIGRDAEMRKTIIAVKLIEISLVDRPNNPDAVLTCWKAEGADEPALAERLARIGEDLDALQADPEWDTVSHDLKAATERLAVVLARGIDAGPDEDESIGKVNAVDLAKVEYMIARAVATLNTQNAMLKAEIAALRAEPAPAKAVLRVIGKTDDTAKGDGFAPVRNPDGSINEAATAMKKVHAAGPVRAG